MNPAPSTATDLVVELLASERSDYRGLYYRWEREQWEAGSIDLAADATEWARLDERFRRAVADAVAWRHLRASQATTALVPFVDAAPSEEQQVFLTTELVDEARHVVLFDRFATEVMGEDAATVAQRAPEMTDPVLGELLLQDLPAISARLATIDAPALDLLIEGVTLYQIGIVGLLDLTEQRSLVDHLESREVLRGLRAGLGYAGRDAARHVAFALRLLEEACAADPRRAETSRGAIQSLYPRLLQVLDRSGRSRVSGTAAAVGSGDHGMNQAAQASCAAWFEAVGLGSPSLG